MIEKLTYVCDSPDYWNYFGVSSPGWEIESNLQRGGLATFIRRNPALDKNEWAPDREVRSGTFGFPLGRLNANDGSRVYRPVARLETIHTMEPFRTAWGAAQRCLIPVHSFAKMDNQRAEGLKYRRISMDSTDPFGIAGIWRAAKTESTDELIFHFAMITVNADKHPVIGRFRVEYEEKRMPLIVLPEHYEAWLDNSIDLSTLTGDCETVGLIVSPPFYRPPPDQFL